MRTLETAPPGAALTIQLDSRGWTMCLLAIQAPDRRERVWGCHSAGNRRLSRPAALSLSNSEIRIAFLRRVSSISRNGWSHCSM